MDITEVIEKMKPEHAEVIQTALTKAADDLATVTEARDTATTEITRLSDELQKAKDAIEKTAADAVAAKEEADAAEAAKAASFDEAEVIKALPEAARAIIEKERAKREAAEDLVRKATEAEDHATAVAKATALKALPIEQEKLVELLKGADGELVDMLTTVATAIEGTVLNEVGKAAGGDSAAAGSEAGWSKIEAAAAEITKADPSITPQRAVAMVIKTKPALYKEYLNGGAK